MLAADVVFSIFRYRLCSITVIPAQQGFGPALKAIDASEINGTIIKCLRIDAYPLHKEDDAVFAGTKLYTRELLETNGFDPVDVTEEAWVHCRDGTARWIGVRSPFSKESEGLGTGGDAVPWRVLMRHCPSEWYLESVASKSFNIA
ncbi:hypothetical protein DPSP01_005375 [Paraphaeosphaeria sporulosa]